MQEIIVEINTNTLEVKLETDGYSSPDCLTDTAALKAALGEAISQEVKPLRGMTHVQTNVRLS